MASAKKKGKKKKKKPGAEKAAPQASGVRGLVMYGAALAAVVIASCILREDWQWFTPELVCVCYVCGLLTGLSGNPLLVLLVPPVIGLAGSMGLEIAKPVILPSDAAGLPVIMTVLSLVAGTATLGDSLKKGIFKYEAVLLTPSLGLTGLAAAYWARHTAPLFNEVMTGLFDGVLFLGFIIVCVFMLVVYEWFRGAGENSRSGLFCIAAGPVIGFWAGYADSHWPYMLMLMLIFLQSPILREKPAVIIASMPLMAAPFWAARTFYPGSGSGVEILGGIIETTGYAPFFAALFLFAAAHLFAFRLSGTVRTTAGRYLFYVPTCIFIAYIFVLLVSGGAG